MGARKLSEREGRLLKLLSGSLMLSLSLCLLLAPERLNDLPVSLGLIGLAVGITALSARLPQTKRGKTGIDDPASLAVINLPPT